MRRARSHVSRMNRRQFLAASVAVTALGAIAWPLTPVRAQSPREPNLTRWSVVTSEGLDAIAFTGALSGGDLYLENYAKEAAEFAPRLPAAVRDDLVALRKDADSSELRPAVARTSRTCFPARTSRPSMRSVAALGEPETRIRPRAPGQPILGREGLALVRRRGAEAAPGLRRDARRGVRSVPQAARSATGLDARAAELQRALSDYDVIRWQQKLSGGRSTRRSTSCCSISRSRTASGCRASGFCRPPTTISPRRLRIAAHELLHPPFDMEGPSPRPRWRRWPRTR